MMKRRQEIKLHNGFVKDGHKLRVDQFTLDGVYIRTFESISAAAKSVGVTPSMISNTCYHYVGHNSSAGYRWEFSDKLNGGDDRCLL